MGNHPRHGVVRRGADLRDAIGSARHREKGSGDQMSQGETNCWEASGCGRAPGGVHAAERGVCPVFEATALDGLNGGHHGGRACWLVAGTLCGGVARGDVASKLDTCLDCDFFSRVRADEGDDFRFGAEWLDAQQSAPLLEAVLTATESCDGPPKPGERARTLGYLSEGLAREMAAPLQYLRVQLDFLNQALPDLTEALRVSARLLAEVEAGGATEATRRAARRSLQTAGPALERPGVVAATQQSLAAVSHVSHLSRFVTALGRHASTTHTLSEVVLSELVADVLAMTRASWHQHARVELTLSPAVPTLVGYADQIRHILLTIMWTATVDVSAAGAVGGRLLIGTEPDRGGVHLTVRAVTGREGPPPPMCPPAAPANAEARRELARHGGSQWREASDSGVIHHLWLPLVAPPQANGPVVEVGTGAPR